MKHGMNRTITLHKRESGAKRPTCVYASPLSLFCISTITLAQSETESTLFTLLKKQAEMNSSSTQMLNKIILYSDEWKVEHVKNQFTVELINYPVGIYFLTFSNTTDKQEIETFTIVRQ